MISSDEESVSDKNSNEVKTKVKKQMNSVSKQSLSIVRSTQTDRNSASRKISMSQMHSLPSFAHLNVDSDTSSEEAEKASMHSIRINEKMSVTDEDLNIKPSKPKNMGYSARNVIIEDQRKMPVASTAIITLKFASSNESADKSGAENEEGE